MNRLKAEKRELKWAVYFLKFTIELKYKPSISIAFILAYNLTSYRSALT